MNELFISQDGSQSILSSKFGVPYHSKYGAVTESKHVFIEAGLSYWLSKNRRDSEIKIFEMGLGTGLNVLLSLDYADLNKLKLHYTAIELFPLIKDTYSKLEYSKFLKNKDLHNHLTSIHQTKSLETIALLPNNFSFTKILGDITKEELPVNQDIVFFDAFAPTSQSELWEIPLLTKMYDILNSNGVLVSYCAKGSFKRNLKTAGFNVESIPGPPGKREMTRAIKL